MPDFYTDLDGNKLVVASYNELVPRFYKTEQSLRSVVSRDMRRGYGIRKVRSGKGCGSFALLEFDSLPAKIRKQLDDPRRDMHPVENFYKHNVEAERFYARYMLSDGRKINALLQHQYTATASAIEAIWALKAERELLFARCGKRPKNLWKNLCDDAAGFRPIQEKKFGVGHRLPNNYRRFQEAVSGYMECENKEDAYKRLISGKHISSSVYGARKVDKRTLDLFESIFTSLGYKPNYTDVFIIYSDFVAGRKEIVSNATGEVLDPKVFPEVSEATIRAYLSRWESKMATLHLRTGDRQVLMSETKPYHSMNLPVYAGSLLSVDDRQPPFEYAAGRRVWFYLGYDVGAQCYTTIVWGKDKQGIILEFYRQMVRNYAQWGVPLPAELEAESSLNASFRETFLQEGNMFRFVRIEANNARGKYIERKNRDARYGEERKSDGWVARPWAREESNRAGVQKVPMLTFEEIVEQTLKRYERYNNEPHPAHPEMTRWEFFMTRQHPDLREINWLGIVPYLGYCTKSSCRTGIVRLNNQECLLGIDGKVAVGDELIGLMKLVDGEELNIKWLDGNDGKVLKAYAYVGDQYVCELVRKPIYSRARIEQTETDMKARELMSKYVATIEGFGNSRKKEIQKITLLEKGTMEQDRFPEHVFSIPQRTGEKRVGVSDIVESDVLNKIGNDVCVASNIVEKSFKRKLIDVF